MSGASVRPCSARVILPSSRAGCCNFDTAVLTPILLVFVRARNKVYREVREGHNRQLPLLESRLRLRFQQHLRAAVTIACY